MSPGHDFAGSLSIQQPSPSIIRPLGWTERLFWLLDRNSPRHFVLAAQVEGRTTEKDWRKALDAVQRRHPLLRVGIAVGEDSVPCFYNAPAAPIPLRIVQRGQAGANWETEFARELASPIDPEHAPLMRATLLPEPDRVTCILSTHHAIADGMSVAFVVRDLLQALSGATLQPLAVLPAYDDLVARVAAGHAPLAGAAGLDLHAPGPPSVYRARDGALPQVRTLGLASELVASLKDRARAEGTTVHGALCSGMALTFAQILGRPAGEPIRIWSPMDVRRLLGLGEDCTLLALSMMVPADPQGPTGFWGAARGVATRLAATRNVEHLAAALAFLSRTIGGLEVAEAARLMARRFPFDFVLTNLGVLPYVARFGQLDLKALWGPAVLSGFENEHVFGVTRTRAGLSLTYSSYTPHDSLFERLERNLVAACA
jgi:hypothetical protein